MIIFVIRCRISYSILNYILIIDDDVTETSDIDEVEQEVTVGHDEEEIDEEDDDDESSKNHDITAFKNPINIKVITGKKLWSDAEDTKLRELVSQKGPRDWPWISSFMPGRSAKQCSKRWNYKLSPFIRHEKVWTTEEDDIIISMQERIGNRWTSIAKLLVGRSDLSVKNRYYALERAKKNNASKPTSVYITDTLTLPNEIDTTKPSDTISSNAKGSGPTPIKTGRIMNPDDRTAYVFDTFSHPNFPANYSFAPYMNHPLASMYATNNNNTSSNNDNSRTATTNHGLGDKTSSTTESQSHGGHPQFGYPPFSYPAEMMYPMHPAMNAMNPMLANGLNGYHMFVPYAMNNMNNSNPMSYMSANLPYNNLPLPPFRQMPFALPTSASNPHVPVSVSKDDKHIVETESAESVLPKKSNKRNRTDKNDGSDVVDTDNRTYDKFRPPSLTL